MSRRPRPRCWTLTLASALALVTLAGCGSSSGSGATPATATPSTGSVGATSTTASATGPTEGTFPPDTATVTSSKTALGTILVDGTGHTLYAYQGDTAAIPTCLGDCAKAWPPLTGAFLGVATAVPVQPHEFKLVTIPGSATKQVVVAGHPLYRFAGDSLAGETKGQGLDQKWYVVGVDGQPITRTG